MNDPLPLLDLLLKKNEIRIDFKELRFQLLSHVDYPSLRSIGGVLDHFNIDNLVVTVPVDKSTLTQLPENFLAQIQTESVKPMAMITKKKQAYEIFFIDGKRVSVSSEELIKIFTGVVVVVDKAVDTSVEAANSAQVLVKRILVAGAGVILTTMLLLSGLGALHLSYLILALVGIWVSATIINQESGVKTRLGEAMCSGAGEKESCGEVLNSSGARLFGGYKLSFMAAVYFSGLTFAFILLSLSSGDYSLLFVLNLLVLPITVYSIYYQWAVLKQWCKLCLTLVVLIWAQTAIVSVNSTIATSAFSLVDLLIASFGFIVAGLFWHFLAPLIGSLETLRQSKIEYFKFKKNFNLFTSLLAKSPTLDTAIPGIEEIVLGSKTAPLQITVITNPRCGYCKEVHTLAEKLYDRYSEKLLLHFRFSMDVSNTESDSYRISSRLAELYHETDTTTCLEAMHDIYEGMEVSSWFSKWGNCNDTERYHRLLKGHSEWCLNNQLNFTPVILINGKAFPKEYNRTDLIYFIEDLAEENPFPIVSRSDAEPVDMNGR